MKLHFIDYCAFDALSDHHVRQNEMLIGLYIPPDGVPFPQDWIEFLSEEIELCLDACSEAKQRAFDKALKRRPVSVLVTEDMGPDLAARLQEQASVAYGSHDDPEAGFFDLNAWFYLVW